METHDGTHKIWEGGLLWTILGTNSVKISETILLIRHVSVYWPLSINNEKTIAKNNDNENHISTNNEIDEENQQSKITEYFIKEIRRQCDKNQDIENINNESNNEEELNLNTQELIEDARERKKVSIYTINQNIRIACEQCEFTTASKTLLNRHMRSQHQQHQEEVGKEMRVRLTCEKCNYKTTSKTVLKQHVQLNHEQKKNKSSKRKVCNVCDKQFNKEATYIHHMKNLHKINIEMEGQNHNPNQFQN